MPAAVSSQIANLAKPQTEAVSGVGLRQYRVARWFLLPEAELRRRLGQGSRLQIWLNVNANLAEL